MQYQMKHDIFKQSFRRSCHFGMLHKFGTKQTHPSNEPTKKTFCKINF